ncbi:lactonase family protein [Microlunatus elymi]|nr:beta-propeller fold lactonase family protein [Microlunatus elymi]
MTESSGAAAQDVADQSDQNPAVPEVPEPAPSDETASDETPVAFDPPERIFVGGYTEEMGGSATGLTAYDGAPDDGVPAQLAALGLGSPSYVIKHPDEPWLFVVHERTPGQVSAVRYDDNGLHLINTVASDGDGGCHLAFDHSGNFVVVAHYTSGSIASFKIEDNGALSERIGLLEFEGSGPDPERQDAAHAHQVVSVGQALLVPDLGTDSVHLVLIDDEGNLSPAGDSIALPAGSGPRHLVLSGQHLVVACELSATLWVSALDAEVGAEGVTVPASTKQTDERIYPSGIAVLGDQVVVANRGADTVSVFTLDASGTPHPLVEIDCGGRWPRDVAVDGEQLWIANQESNNVTVIRPARVSNKPEDWQTVLQLPTPSPACVVPTR